LVLKEIIKELQKSVILKPLFVKPITAIHTMFNLEDVLETSSRLKGSSRLLMEVRKYIGDGITKIIDLILEIWELAQSSTTFSTRVFHFKKYLQKDLENDEPIRK
jgi:hypothetical protein